MTGTYEAGRIIEEIEVEGGRVVVYKIGDSYSVELEPDESYDEVWKLPDSFFELCHVLPALFKNVEYGIVEDFLRDLGLKKRD